MFSKDIGPGNCLIDNWIRNNSNKRFDLNGELASLGKKNEIILEQAIRIYEIELIKKKNSLDTSDFDVSFLRGLSLEDGTATITDFTASVIGESISLILNKDVKVDNILVCGGGRKNKILLKKLEKNQFKYQYKFN